MRLGRAGMLALMMQPEALPSLFATAEPDVPAPPRVRPKLGDWPVRLRGWVDRSTPRRFGFWGGSAASW